MLAFSALRDNVFVVRLDNLDDVRVRETGKSIFVEIAVVGLVIFVGEHFDGDGRFEDFVFDYADFESRSDDIFEISGHWPECSGTLKAERLGVGLLNSWIH